MGKGGGGGLAFLNKKSWHPGGFKQQEDVWKREQAKAQEDKRLEELKKQYAEEREAQELLRAAQEAGHATKTERLEFMYKGHTALDGPMLSALAPPAAPEPAVPLPAALAAPTSAAASALAVYVDDTPKARNEAWSRMHGDPMLMIRQQEQASLKSIRANPVKMDTIMREVEALKAARRAKKEAKHAKKEAKREAKRARRDGARDSSPSSEEDERRAVPRGGDGRSAAPPLPHAPPHDARHGRAAHGRSRSPRARSPRRRSRSRDGRRRSASREQRRSRSRERRRSRSRERRRSRSRSRERRRSRERGEERARAPANPAPVTAAAPAPPARSDGAVAQRGVAEYGLTFASAEAKAAAHSKAEARAEQPAYAPAKAPVAAPPPTWAAGRNSAGHRAGKLTDEERAARLAAMAADAEQHEDARWQRLRRDEARDAGDTSMEAHAPAHHHSEKPAFLGAKERELFGGDSGGMTMADRVGARKHFQQRGPDGGNAFAR